MIQQFKMPQEKCSSSTNNYFFFFPWETCARTPIVASVKVFLAIEFLLILYKTKIKKIHIKVNAFFFPRHLKKSHFSLKIKVAHCKLQYDLLLNGARDKRMCPLETVR